ncbi:fuconate dehydratase [Streptomyces sp. RS2]|uniref:enolase C-terminal domain-like protein n=1 Tax=Streptomyces sp. RS2 TaxID=1451205 RepID=UPI0021F8ED8E|nr:enolase C-terminal domain-like protein [Streptomyces sp. RS2]MCW1100145.1 fuconate dehydratase [Streptomyces sp. RS2]
MSVQTARISALETYDIRFPTSRELDGSDAMNPDPDYSAAYLVLRTDASDEPEGHGFVFTIGRGNDIQVAAIEALRPYVVGRRVDELCADPGALARDLNNDSQLRWLGPEKGIMHMAVGAVVNAVWDLAAKRARKPLWKLLADAEPEWLVSQIDFRYLSDALTEQDALELLRRGHEGRQEREWQLTERGFPAYTTQPGWLGYSDEKLSRLAKEAVADGFRQIKLKVGDDLDDDIRRCRTARSVIGPEIRMAIDANQRWDVDEAITWTRALAEFEPYWIEEPTSPDDVLGHAAVRRAVTPVKVATGEHVQNRVVFKQLLQAGSIDIPGCARQVFAEQIPGLARRHSQRTERLCSALASVGLALAGRARARIVRVIGISVGRSRVLRLGNALPEPEVDAPRVVGVEIEPAAPSTCCPTGRHPAWRAGTPHGRGDSQRAARGRAGSATHRRNARQRR